MKKVIQLIVLLSIVVLKGYTQNSSPSEQYGKTLNLGLGIGYYGYTTHPVGEVHADYEFDIFRNFTLAPFINFYSYRNDYYWGDPYYPYKNYSYTETVIPIGVKGAYYFDELMRASSKWDFYVATSVGFAIRTVTWSSDYYGDKNAYSNASALYFSMHAGAEYHLSQRVGLFLDLSTGVSTVGIAIH